MLLFGRPHDDSKGQSSSIDSEESRRFDNALFSTLDALEERKVSYALIGGVAASSLGRPRATQDIDIFVRPEDADATLEVLKEYGFKTNRFNPSWLFKAYKDKVLIDIIFRSEGSIYFDDEMRDNSIFVQYHGRRIRVVSPEDFIIIKCAVHSEEGYHHWHDALAVLAQAKVNWDYLLHRSRKAPRRLLALLVYAQSCDIGVPNYTIQRLFDSLFGESHFARKPDTISNSLPTQRPVSKPVVKPDVEDAYLAAKVRDALEKSEKVGALGIEVRAQEGQILVRGEVPTDIQRQSVLDVVEEVVPSMHIEDQLHVRNWQAPKDIEVLR